METKTKKFEVGDKATWKVPMYDSFLHYPVKILKIFKNGKARIQYRSGYGAGPLQATNTEMSNLY